jgi:hypothetical protein
MSDRPPSSATELPPSRRQALAKLGLAATVAYAAPTILHLDRSAKAQILPSCVPPPGFPDCNNATPAGGDSVQGAPAAAPQQ